MLRKLLSAVGLIAATSTSAAVPPYAPYSSAAANDIYNLLFCDQPDAFLAKPGQEPTEWQRALASNPADVASLEAIGADPTQEGRVRYLAYQRLRNEGRTVPAKRLLGVIVEVPLAGGLDTLAAYSEGGVRYINQSGKLVVIEAVPAFKALAEQLLAASQPVVSVIGAWDKPRRGPPQAGNVRLSFLVSDGLYFGEGPMPIMQRDYMAAPVIQRATELLQAVVAVGTK